MLAKVKTNIGRIWNYVRDDTPFSGPAPPAALFQYSGDRRGEHPVEHLGGWAGVLQADAYAGYNALLKPGSGLIDHSQKMTAAAMVIAEKKVWAHLS